MSLSAATRITAKHALITQALIDEIERGRYKVGGMLPSEPELARLFGVSRQTVRVALRNLRELGLVAPQQGVGSIVRADSVHSRYAQSFESASDLLQYATRTRVDILSISEVNVDAELAAWLECKAGERWWRMENLRSSGDGGRANGAGGRPNAEGVRHNAEGVRPSAEGVRPNAAGVPIAYSHIYLPYAFGSVLRDPAVTRTSIFSLVEKQFNEVITEIRQEITAVLMSAAEARLLKSAPRKAALLIVRRYVGKQGRVIEVSRSVHPADAFNYSMHVRLSPAR